MGGEKECALGGVLARRKKRRGRKSPGRSVIGMSEFANEKKGRLVTGCLA